MKFVRFICEDKEHIGVLVGEGKILSLSTIPSSAGFSVPKSLEDLVLKHFDEIERVGDILEEPSIEHRKGAIHHLDRVVLLAPISHPPKIICLGLNYYDHAAEGGTEVPDNPIIFMKPRTAITGPDQPIIKPGFVEQLDYEVELAVVIGKKGKNIPVEDAEDHIFGYTVMNDVSARQIQFKDRQWTRGKSLDTFAPMGPCITTAHQIGDPGDLRMQAWVNDELRQDSSTKNMVFDVSQTIHHLSRIMTLEPCDVIATGTPAGVGVYMKPPRFLQPGDRVVMEIEGIGRLQNKVAEEREGHQIRL